MVCFGCFRLGIPHKSRTLLPKSTAAWDGQGNAQQQANFRRDAAKNYAKWDVFDPQIFLVLCFPSDPPIAMAEHLETYITRITWNEDNWRRPSGSGAKTETRTYVARYGFGHEEWLNRREWLFGGLRYAFLQGVGRSLSRLRGQRLCIRLYTITPMKERLYVGELTDAEVIGESAARAIVGEMRQRGLLRTMAKEVRDVGGDGSLITTPDSPTSICNIRFKPEDLRMFRRPVAAAPLQPTEPELSFLCLWFELCRSCASTRLRRL